MKLITFLTNHTWLPSSDTATPNNTPGNYTEKECVPGRLLEKAVLVILKKNKPDSDDEEQTNDDVAAQEARGQDVEQTRTSLESLLRIAGLFDQDEDTSKHLKRWRSNFLCRPSGH